jgi:hypothetical protein
MDGAAAGEALEGRPGSQSVARAAEAAGNQGDPEGSRRTNYEGQAGRGVQRQEEHPEASQGVGFVHSSPQPGERLEAGEGANRLTKHAQATRCRKNDGSTWANLPARDTRRVSLKSPVRANRTPGSVRGAPGNRCPYLDMCSLRALTYLQVQDLPRQGMVGSSSDSRLRLGETPAGASSAVNSRQRREGEANGPQGQRPARVSRGGPSWTEFVRLVDQAAVAIAGTDMINRVEPVRGITGATPSERGACEKAARRKEACRTQGKDGNALLGSTAKSKGYGNQAEAIPEVCQGNAVARGPSLGPLVVIAKARGAGTRLERPDNSPQGPLAAPARVGWAQIGSSPTI